MKDFFSGEAEGGGAYANPARECGCEQGRGGDNLHRLSYPPSLSS